ncbi:MAG: MgtC/SapB family protein [Sulfuricaulis sp.]|uniref:MgtC/SapB family protein n=1 Tax=Sulfuricaulis sp. TaxID=2003553 RepID=UPI0034A584E4
MTTLIFVEREYLTILLHLGLAVLAGGLIGLERTYHGRPAGFRTHTLVCTASSLLMLLTVYQWQLLPNAPLDTVRVDPTRMAQGIMTGIGFLGAGVIMKEGLTVRGLTTAASIWITASIGILIGIGFYFPAVVATLVTLGTLSLFRWIEAIMPSQFYARLHVRYKRNEAPAESDLRELITRHGFSIANLSYQLAEKGKIFEYQMTICTQGKDSYRRLAETLTARKKVREFHIFPTGD